MVLFPVKNIAQIFLFKINEARQAKDWDDVCDDSKDIPRRFATLRSEAIAKMEGNLIDGGQQAKSYCLVLPSI
jgi:hypothetical protein